MAPFIDSFSSIIKVPEPPLTTPYGIIPIDVFDDHSYEFTRPAYTHLSFELRGPNNLSLISTIPQCVEHYLTSVIQTIFHGPPDNEVPWLKYHPTWSQIRKFLHQHRRSFVFCDVVLLTKDADEFQDNPVGCPTFVDKGHISLIKSPNLHASIEPWKTLTELVTKEWDQDNFRWSHAKIHFEYNLLISFVSERIFSDTDDNHHKIFRILDPGFKQERSIFAWPF